VSGEEDQSSGRDVVDDVSSKDDVSKGKHDSPRLKGYVYNERTSDRRGLR
jgi:hypothetical protein